jgi:hypothetical protein
MSEEATEVTAQEAAPNADETASPAEAPVSGEAKPDEQPKPAKTFTQEEVDSLVSKRLARAERQWKRELDQRLAANQPPPKVEQPATKPQPDSFKTTEEYLEALTDWKVEERMRESSAKAQRQAAEQQSRQQAVELDRTFEQRAESAREKYDDFDALAFNPQLPITDAMAATLKASENGAELAYYLGQHPEEASRIARLSPFLQAKELGRIEAKLPQAEAKPNPPAKKTSSAPAPIDPVKPKGSGGFVDTTDPKSLEKLGTSGWIEAERARQRREWEARNR